MKTIIPFIPSNLIVPTIQVTLDGSPYKLVVTWNVSAQRYYINLYDMDGNWIITTPLIGSPPNRMVESVKYVLAENRVYVRMVDPAMWPFPLSPGGIVTKPGTIIEYTLESFQPETYNGKYRALHINETLFSIPMPTNPGPILVIGCVCRLLDMVTGLFKTSTLIYRNGCFEVNP